MQQNFIFLKTFGNVKKSEIIWSKKTDSLKKAINCPQIIHDSNQEPKRPDIAATAELVFGREKDRESKRQIIILETKLNLFKRKLKLKNKKTPIITLLTTATKTKNNTHLFLVVHMLDNMISY